MVESVTQAAALADRIGAQLPGLSKKQQRIARFVLEEPEYVAFASAADIGNRTRSSAATVVRLCQALGYEGYIQLQMAVREGITIQRTAVQRLEARLASPIAEEDVLTRVSAADIHNIELTLALTDRDRFAATVDVIRRARRILVVGDGSAAGLVTFFSHALQVMGLPARELVGGGEPLALALAFLDKGDLLFAIGFWRNLRDVVQAVEQANEAGVKTVGITDNRLSPLARLVDYPFLTATDGVAHNLSPAATMSLLNGFLAALSIQMGDQVVASLRRVDDAYRRGALLSE